MMKKVRLLLYALTASVALAACSGEDGEPGPKGDTGAKGDTGEKGDAGEDAASRNGYFEGTIKGTRRDGTAFEETFKYEYMFGSEIFDGNDRVTLQRFETASGAIADAVATAAGNEAPLDKGYFKFFAIKDGASIDIEDLKVFFKKGVSASQLFQLKAQPHLADETYNRLIELTPEQNGVYNFDYLSSGRLSYYETDLDWDGKNDAFLFQDRDNVSYTYAYSLTTGELVSVIFNGEAVNNNTLIEKYNDIKFVYNDELGQNVFVKTSDGSALYEYVEFVAGDEFTMTNYSNANGVISFDFTLKISKYRGYLGTKGPWGTVMDSENTTRHDMTITGKFSSGDKVYNETVSRARG
jgi:hypothetical protein